MGIRSPKSSAALEIPSVADLRGDARPEPPEDLTEEQAAEWRAVVDLLPADWFPRETHGRLAQYCRHVVTARRIAKLLADMEADPKLNVRDYDRLLKAQERESRCIASLATRMRISRPGDLATFREVAVATTCHATPPYRRHLEITAQKPCRRSQKSSSRRSTGACPSPR